MDNGHLQAQGRYRISHTLQRICHRLDFIGLQWICFVNMVARHEASEQNMLNSAGDLRNLRRIGIVTHK